MARVAVRVRNHRGQVHFSVRPNDPDGKQKNRLKFCGLRKRMYLCKKYKDHHGETLSRPKSGLTFKRVFGEHPDLIGLNHITI